MAYAFSRGTVIVTCNSQVNMSNSVITEHGTPVNQDDVANKDYVDTLTQGIVTTDTVTLTGTAPVAIGGGIQSGSGMLLVKNLITGGPAATFLLSKSEAGREPSISRFTTSAGDTTGERLEVLWGANTGIQIFKTGVSYDGDYAVKILII